MTTPLPTTPMLVAILSAVVAAVLAGGTLFLLAKAGSPNERPEETHANTVRDDVAVATGGDE